MDSLSGLLSSSSPLPALIIPSKPDSVIVSYRQFHAQVWNFQRNLAQLGLRSQDAVTIILPNCYEFAVAFLAISWQRAIAAPLNPAYQEDEFGFYIEDIKSALVIVPRGAFAQNHAGVRAARRHEVAIVECFWDGNQVILDMKYQVNLTGKENTMNARALASDIALVLHTSGTTAKPKAVSSAGALFRSALNREIESSNRSL